MTRIALTAAALPIAANAAFASSDKFGSNNASQAPVASKDKTITTSIEKSNAIIRKPVVQGSNRDLFGNR
ncbi:MULTISPECIES: DUF680 domain-containing protein [unclassified Mesorhizobium]|uniref:DUF680 domain-containing protein n=1 Tax=unclassified Mesorhizobium TaxID=325217 RepID=UPI00112E7C4F|nr:MULTISPECIES: DUF680 domain-containing protein [unclassified Mesorhizobium]MCA0056193.1 DUF680 domain-containing protein [Mesorhizobium sp. B261B1A]TPL08078.1 DUF680 domain-containing protein [Mesorhizobium sp. B2-4-11]TPN17611.1 DUF680 domain-containing protein [Mesorhizobium sp. B2-1-3]